MIVGCGDLTILLVGLGFHCFLLKCKEKLRHSLGRPSRSDFVQLEFNDVIHSLNLDSLIYPKHITAEYILQYVRAMKNSIGSNVETLYKLMEDRVEALEFIVNQNCRMIGIRLQDMKTRPNLLVAAINRQGKVIIPGGQDSFEAGDSVIIVTTETGLQDIHEILAE